MLLLFADVLPRTAPRAQSLAPLSMLSPLVYLPGLFGTRITRQRSRNLHYAVLWIILMGI
jgi:hypothetical protein